MFRSCTKRRRIGQRRHLLAVSTHRGDDWTMLNTSCILAWRIQLPCSIWNLPSKRRIEVTSTARTYFASRSGSGIYGDYFVYGLKGGVSSEGKKYSYPQYGFRISESFDGLGGPEALRAMCAQCPAMIAPQAIAGCWGGFKPYGEYSQDMENHLQGILDRLNLREAYEREFPKTKLLWFGLWTQSPLSPVRLTIIRSIFTTMLDDFRFKNKNVINLELFVRATEVAEERGYALHAEFDRPHHLSCGAYEVLPSCPFCRAAGNFEWKIRYPTEAYECEICGTWYSPNKMASHSYVDVGPDEEQNLRTFFDQAGFEQFAKDYLTANGLTENEAAVVVAQEEENECKSQIKRETQRKRQLLRWRFIYEVLYKDIKSEADEEGNRAYRGEEFSKILARCNSLGIKPRVIYQHTPDGNLTMHECRDKNPFEELKKLRESREYLFSGGFHIPPALLDEFHASLAKR